MWGAEWYAAPAKVSEGEPALIEDDNQNEREEEPG